jgi:hypothetical protein
MRPATITLGAALLVAGAALASAATDEQCVANAQRDRVFCRVDCQEEYFEAKDLCRNIAPACGARCRTERSGCMGPLVAALAACTDRCMASLQLAKSQCPPEEDSRREACVDLAEVEAFTCRDECRDRWRSNGTVRVGVKFCRDQFRICVRGCLPSK